MTFHINFFCIYLTSDIVLFIDGESDNLEMPWKTADINEHFLVSCWWGLFFFA